MMKNIAPRQVSFANQRESSIELLRLVCMFFIVLQHIIKSAIFPEVQNDGAWTLGSYVGAMMLGFVCVGVNCFVLISGFFGIKFRLRSLFNLYLICAFYNLIAYGVHLGLDDAQVGKSLILNTLFPFSHSTWWFINCYVQLYILAPLINYAIDNINRQQHIYAILGLTFTNVYIGHFWQTELYDNYGMSTMHFLYLYIIGRYIGKYVSTTAIDMKRYKWLLLFVGCAVLAGFGQCIDHFGLTNNYMGLSNNSPLMIGSAIGLLLYAKSFHFQSRFINSIAISTLAIYLGHEHEYVRFHLYNSISQLHQTYIDTTIVANDMIGRITFCVIFALIICVSILVFDKVRLLLMIPIWKLYDKVEPNIILLLHKI